MTLEITKSQYVNLDTDRKINKFLFEDNNFDDTDIYYRVKTHDMIDSSDYYFVITENQIGPFSDVYLIVNLEMISM